MTLIQLQILTTSLVILYFTFGINRKILKARNKKPWDTLKPFTCFFCMSMHIGFSVALGTLIGSWVIYNAIPWELLVFFTLQNFILSTYLDKALGYDSEYVKLLKEIEKLREKIKQNQS